MDCGGPAFLNLLSEKLSMEEWLKRQGRFRHLFRDENRHLIDDLQNRGDRRWERLLELSREA